MYKSRDPFFYTGVIVRALSLELAMIMGTQENNDGGVG